MLQIILGSCVIKFEGYTTRQGFAPKNLVICTLRSVGAGEGGGDRPGDPVALRKDDVASEHLVAACGEPSCKGRRQLLESVSTLPVPLCFKALARSWSYVE